MYFNCIVPIFVMLFYFSQKQAILARTRQIQHKMLEAYAGKEDTDTDWRESVSSQGAGSDEEYEEKGGEGGRGKEVEVASGRWVSVRVGVRGEGVKGEGVKGEGYGVATDGCVPYEVGTGEVPNADQLKMLATAGIAPGDEGLVPLPHKHDTRQTCLVLVTRTEGGGVSVTPPSKKGS